MPQWIDLLLFCFSSVNISNINVCSDDEVFFVDRQWFFPYDNNRYLFEKIFDHERNTSSVTFCFSPSPSIRWRTNERTDCSRWPRLHAVSNRGKSTQVISLSVSFAFIILIRHSWGVFLRGNLLFSDMISWSNRLVRKKSNLEGFSEQKENTHISIDVDKRCVLPFLQQTSRLLNIKESPRSLLESNVFFYSFRYSLVSR